MQKKGLLASIVAVAVFVLHGIPGHAQAVAAGGAHMTHGAQGASADGTRSSDAIRPFHVNVPESALTDLRQRVQATRWPDRETVKDRSQGVKLDNIQELVRYWGTDYDWRKAESKLNALPQFVTTIDGLDIQFVHIRSKHPNALPLIVTHGWPGSIFELLKIVGPLTDPTAYGGRAEDAFDLVLPSMPGYGFSGKPTATGWDADHIARAWDVLMKRLGYKRYVSSGGDWGSVVADKMAHQKPDGLLGIHVNMPATVPADVAKALNNGDPAPAGLSEKEKAAFVSLNYLYKKGGFPGEIYRAPKSWAERSYHKLIYFHEVDKGGHFAQWEQPQLFAEETRAAFRSLR